MPVTARLSKRFYEVLGEDVANELVDWFNAVDLTYRTDLRELNELELRPVRRQAGAAPGRATGGAAAGARGASL